MPDVITHKIRQGSLSYCVFCRKSAMNRLPHPHLSCLRLPRASFFVAEHQRRNHPRDANLIDFDTRSHIAQHVICLQLVCASTSSREYTRIRNTMELPSFRTSKDGRSSVFGIRRAQAISTAASTRARGSSARSPVKTPHSQARPPPDTVRRCLVICSCAVMVRCCSSAPSAL